MKKNVVIKKLGINGEGIGYIDRKIVFIPGALPEEEVVVEIVKQTRTYSEGKIVQIVKPSKDRVSPKCRFDNNCQGCNMLHLNYFKQLTAKKEAVRESIRKYTNYDLSKTVFKDVIAAPKQEGFITSVNLPIVDFKDKISFGIYQRDSKYLILMTKCFKQHPMINDCLVALEEILTDHKCKTYSDKFRTGLRFLKVKLIDEKLQLVFITGRDGLKEEIVKEISELPNVASIFMSVNTSKHQEFDELGYSKLYGMTRLELNNDNKKYLVSVKSKLPENLEMMWKQHQVIKTMVQDSKKIISLNCGVGLLELNLAQEIVAIDEKHYQIDDAKLNAKYLKGENDDYLNRDNLTFVAGDVDSKIVAYAKKKIYDTLIVQNERYGLSDTIKDTIKIARFKTIVYACQSHSTLAKDLADLQKDYHLERIVGLDTSCHNSYLTTIVKLVRK